MPDRGHDAGGRVWTRSGRLELLANVAVIALIPLLSRLLYPIVGSSLRGFGFGTMLDALSGRGGFTDVGWEVAASAGLVDRAYSAYDSITRLGPLIGMEAYGDAGVTHLPPSLVLGIPLTVVDYRWWLSFWVVAAVCAVALSMRVMGVPAWVAYPVSIGICLTPAGMFSTMSTYPMAALLLALAWAYRAHPVIAGTSYALLAAARGLGALLLVYPLVRRQWRTLLVAAGVIVGLTLVAMALEPTVVGDFLAGGRGSIEHAFENPGNYTFDAVLGRHGLPRWLAWAAALAVAIAGLARRREVFWLAAWFMFAVTPIGFAHTPVQAVPLAVVMWQSGRLGRFLTLLLGAVFFATVPIGWNVARPILIVISAVAVIACPLGSVNADGATGDGPVPSAALAR